MSQSNSNSSIHDQFCRCRPCKPSLAGSPPVEFIHAGWGILIALAVTATLLIVAAL